MTASIPAPKDFALPEGVNEGDPFRLLCTLRLTGKRLDVLALGDTDMEDQGFTAAVKRSVAAPAATPEPDEDDV